EPEMPEALGDRLEPGALGLVPELVVRVGAVDDLGEQAHRRVFLEAVLLHDRLEAALEPPVAELAALDVERRRAEALRLVGDLVARDEEELGLGVDELPEEPGASDAIDLDLLPRDPAHARSPSARPGPARLPAARRLRVARRISGPERLEDGE